MNWDFWNHMNVRIDVERFKQLIKFLIVYFEKGCCTPFFIKKNFLNLKKQNTFMENYTNPEKEGQEQNTQDLLNASLIFARALGNIFSEGEGIVVDVVGDIKLSDEVKKVIVFRHNDQVHIYKCDQDLEEGTAVNMNDDTENDVSNIEVNDVEIVTPDEE